MKFRVLGPLSVKDNGMCCTPTAPKQRQMLGLLLLTPGHVVPVSRLIEELWDHRPPTRAIAAIHTYVMQLRKKLSVRPARSAGSRIITRNRGYRLDVQPGELDLDVFDQSVRSAQVAHKAGDDASAAGQLHEVLAATGSAPLVDVPTGPILEDGIAVLEQRRLEAVVLRNWADLNLGRHHELIGELSALAYHHATNEDLIAQLMIALHRSGRRVDALDAFHRLRHALAGELGTAPSHRMHQLYTDIVAADPKLHQPPVAEPGLSLDLVYTAS
jgi:DNA-binding SARP family transcriptional activator